MSKGLNKHLITATILATSTILATCNPNFKPLTYYEKNEPQYGIKVHKRTKPSKKKKKK